MLLLLLVAAAILSAFQVMRSVSLLISTLWLAVTSALVATILYVLGAPEVAVIELSVGAGLVTVLFVFAFSIVGEDTFDEKALVPKPLVWGMVTVVAILLSWFTFPEAGDVRTALEMPFSQVLWEQRALDVLAQIVLIFGGVVGLIGLLAETRSSVDARVQTLAAGRQVHSTLELKSAPAYKPGTPAAAGTKQAAEQVLKEVEG